MGGRTLKEHCEGSKIIENYTFNYSKQALADLGFISEINSVWVPNDDENVRNIHNEYVNFQSFLFLYYYYIFFYFFYLYIIFFIFLLFCLTINKQIYLSWNFIVVSFIIWFTAFVFFFLILVEGFQWHYFSFIYYEIIVFTSAPIWIVTLWSSFIFSVEGLYCCFLSLDTL